MRRKLSKSAIIGMLSVLLALFMGVGFAQEERLDASGQWWYDLAESGATIKLCVGKPSGELVIPGEIDGYPVTGISEKVFYDHSPGVTNRFFGLTGVVIPEGVKVIGDKAFQGCANLTYVSLPPGLERIGDNAFTACYGLTDMTIPEGVTSIGNDAFSLCESLASVVVPESVTDIGRDAFKTISVFNVKGRSKLILSVEENSYAEAYAKRHHIPYEYAGHAPKDQTAQTNELPFASGLIHGRDGYSAVAAGDWHSLAIDEQGRLYTWGSNYPGLLGDDKYTELNPDTMKVSKNADVYAPVRLQLNPEKRFVHVAAGAMHSLALDDSGMLYAWGNNFSGQVGEDRRNNVYLKPVPVMDNVRWASACDNTTVAIQTDSTLWIWGRQDLGLYADRRSDDNFRPRQVASGVARAAAMEDCILYIDGTGQLWGIGRRNRLGLGDQNPRSFEIEPVHILSDIVDIAVGHAVDDVYKTLIYAVDEQGNLYCWGDFGNDVYTPTHIMEDVARIFSPALILKRDGSLWAYGKHAIWWGHYESNGSAHGTSYLYDSGNGPDAFVKVLDHVQFADGRQHFLAMDENGVLYGWGCNVFGQVGAGKRTKIQHRLHRDKDTGETYDELYVKTILDASAPMKLPMLMQVKKNTKVTIQDILP